MQTNPRLTRQLEITNLHVRLLHDPDNVARKTSDLNFLFYFRDIFDDYFRKVLFYLVLKLNLQSIIMCRVAGMSSRFPTLSPTQSPSQ